MRMLLLTVIRQFCSRLYPASLSLTRRTFKCNSRSNQSIIGSRDKLIRADILKPEQKDLIIYRQEPTNYYRILNIFCFSQFILWTYISASCYNLRDLPIDQKIIDDKDTPFWKKVNFGEAKYRWTFVISFMLVGYSILGTGWFYISRSVQFIVLRKDRSTVAFATYSPFKRSRIMEYHLDKISAVGSRNSVNTAMPIQINGRRFHYIIDVSKGHFPHPMLFDQTVGIKRRL